MNYYPVLIPTLNRYEHFRRCVESLSRCTHAEETELVIGLDYPPSEKYREGYEKIKAYIPQITGFKKVTCIKREYNYGAVNNSTDLTSRYFKIYDALIISEDDNEFAPCFLDFMDKALEKYANTEKVNSVTSYTVIGLEGIPYSTYFTSTVCAWGVGIWKHKSQANFDYCNFGKDILQDLSKSMKIFFSSPNILSMLINMVKLNAHWGDVCKSAINILDGKMQLRSKEPLVINHGHDGTGLHSATNTKLAKAFAKRGLCPKTEYEVGDIPLQVPIKVRIHSILKNELNQIDLKVPLKTILKYIKYRIYFRNRK